MDLATSLKARALEIGFDLVGVAPLAAGEDLEFSRRWVEEGYGGEMHYLKNPKRDHPRRVLPSAKSVICVGLVYNTPLPYSTELVGQSSAPGGEVSEARGRGPKTSAPESRIPIHPSVPQETTGKRVRAGEKGHTGESHPRAWISRYAWGRDYHQVMRAKLERLRRALEELSPGVETRVYVDTGPVVERALARYSGIGWMGKNTCLINQEKGSWFFIGVVLTSLGLAPDFPAPDLCGKCTRCLDACPTGALVEPYVMDASRCIAYFTIELKGAIPVDFRPAIGSNVFGCDICQDVCPWNNRRETSIFRGPAEGPEARSAATTGLAEFQPMEVRLAPQSSAPESRKFSLFNPPLEALASVSEDDFQRLFARSPIKRAKYRGWVRNLCVAMGNSGDARFLPWLRRAREHPDPVIRVHAAWAHTRIAGRTPKIASEIRSVTERESAAAGPK